MVSARATHPDYIQPVDLVVLVGASDLGTGQRRLGRGQVIRKLSPDGSTLYVDESNSGQVWSYAIRGSELTSPRLLKTFEPDTVDGLRTDVAGKLLVARIRKGMVAVMKPSGDIQQEVVLQGREPTNLAFGGADGRTVFVTQRQGGYIEAFRTDKEGREHCMQKASC